MKKTYIVRVGGASWSRGPLKEHTSKRAAMAAAVKATRSYGTTANYVVAETTAGDLLATWRRDGNGDGRRWRRAV
jgi:hypothetical protein